MTHNFNQIPSVNIERSAFNEDHGLKTTFDAGKLIPIYWDEALPGDTFHLRASLFGRLATPIKPIMDNIYLETFYFAIPYRLVWENWQKFMGEQKTLGASTDYLCPQVTAPQAGFASQSLFDMFGLPIGINGIKVDSFHLRAYNLVYNEWFRDQNLMAAATIHVDDGTTEVYTDYIIRTRGKRHDYFTSCLPWPQKGPGVNIPLGSVAPVYGTGKALALTDGVPEGSIGGMAALGADPYGLDVDTAAFNTFPGSFVSGSGSWQGSIGVMTQGQVFANTTPDDPTASGLYADLTDATAATINDLRIAFQLQKMYERDARGGTRYVEIIKSHFGVNSPDYRLQRPEYLGGGSCRVNINPVQQTSATTSQPTPQGNLSGYGIAHDTSGGFSKSFTEHTILIGLANIRTDLTYQQGLDRMWSRQTRDDFYWPSYAHLGEQAVLMQEIYCTGTTLDETVFGYQERYAEYRYKKSNICGLFRHTIPGGTSLDIWHLGQAFSGPPALNEAFIKDTASYDGIYRASAVNTEPQIILDAFFKLKKVRPMPVYSIPGLIDHF